MTTAEYLILITALLMLAAAMVYGKMARRSKSKEVKHHSFDSISFESSTISSPPSSEDGELSIDLQDQVDESLEVRLKKPDDSLAADDGGEFLDDLQDAAAGLARLMHSSETDRAITTVGSVDPSGVQDQNETPAEPVDETVEIINKVESVLGEEVVDQIGRIDSELDALEELVASIEESLEAFSELSGDDLLEESKEGDLAEAA